MKLKCTCESTDFSKLKFGGRQFQLQYEGKIALFKGSGFEPDIWACNKCGKIIFSVPDDERK